VTPAERLAWLTGLASSISGEPFRVAFALSAGFGRVQGPSLHRIAKRLGLTLEATERALEALQACGAVRVTRRWPNGWPRAYAPGVLGQADDVERAVVQAMDARRALRRIAAERRRRRCAG
jgi:hypothetical protein